MKVKEIKCSKHQELIRWLMSFTGASEITKGEQKTFFRIVEELKKRGIIEDKNDFVKSTKPYLRSDCLPEEYSDLFNR